MWRLLRCLLVSSFQLFRSAPALGVENLALRHQLAVLQRQQRGRLSLRPLDRLLWVFLVRDWPSWRSALVLVKPETMLAWHRRGFKLFWRVKM